MFYIKNFYFCIDKKFHSVYTVYIRYIHRRVSLNIIISNNKDKPIYEQITYQIKMDILNGKLKQGDSLPSIRALAKDLKISVITTKRAYEDLQKEGFIETVAGKGTFISSTNKEVLKEQNFKIIEKKLAECISIAKASNISIDEFKQIIDIIYEED